MPIGGRFFVFKANDEMHRVLAHLISCDLGLEIKSAERTVAASYCIEFGVEIINTMRLLID